MEKKTIKFYLDTANLADIRQGLGWGAFCGLTINPVLLAKETKDYKNFVKEILATIPNDWDVSLQVESGEHQDMIRQARELASWDKRIRVKISADTEGLIAASQLAKEIPLNLTVIKLSAQALLCQALASKVKAKDMVISIFCGRLNQAGYQWTGLLKNLSLIAWPGKIIAASIKTPKDIADAVANGADIVTAPLDVYKIALTSPLVKEDIDNFNQAFQQGKLKII